MGEKVKFNDVFDFNSRLLFYSLIKKTIIKKERTSLQSGF